MGLSVTLGCGRIGRSGLCIVAVPGRSTGGKRLQIRNSLNSMPRGVDRQPVSSRESETSLGVGYPWCTEAAVDAAPVLALSTVWLVAKGVNTSGEGIVGTVGVVFPLSAASPVSMRVSSTGEEKLVA